MKRPTCSDCPYWKEPLQRGGECCRYAPQTDAEGEGEYTTSSSFCGDHPDFDNWAKYQHTLTNLRYGENFIELEKHGKFVIVNAISGGYHWRNGEIIKGPNFTAIKEGAKQYDSPLEAMEAAKDWPASLDWSVESTIEPDDEKESFTMNVEV